MLLMLLPVLIGHARAIGTVMLDLVVSMFKRRSRDDEKYYTRVIEYVQRTTSWGSTMTSVDEKNNILQKAIILHLSRLEIEYRSCDLSLTAVKRADAHASSGKQKDDDGDEEPSPSSTDVYGNTASQLKAYTISKMPPVDVWVTVTKDSDGACVQFRQTNGDKDKPKKDGKEDEEKGASSDKFNQKRIKFELRSSRPNGRELHTQMPTRYSYMLSELDGSMTAKDV